MVEDVELVGNLVHIRTDDGGGIFFERFAKRVAETGQRQSQVAFAGSGESGKTAGGSGCSCAGRNRSGNLRMAFLKLGKNGLYPHHGIKDIRPGIAFKRGKLVNVKNIIAFARVHQVAVFDGGEADGLFQLPQFGCGHFLFAFNRNFAFYRIQQFGEFHRAAGTGFEGFAVFAVDGAETDERQFGFGAGYAGFAGAAENALKMQRLAFVDNIHDTVRAEIPFALDEGGKVGRFINCAAVGFQNNARRDWRGIAFFFDIYDESPFAFIGEPLIFHHPDHIGNKRVGIAFAEPEIKVDVQPRIVAL